MRHILFASFRRETWGVVEVGLLMVWGNGASGGLGNWFRGEAGVGEGKEEGSEKGVGKSIMERGVVGV